MRRLGYFGATALVLIACNVLIIQKEMLKASDQTVYLKLAPVDPRSLLMGDYMALNYELSTQARGTAAGEGRIVVRLDERKVGTFVRVHGGEALAANERLLKFHERYGTLQVGPAAYYFQEGQAATFSRAQFGELRVSQDGDCLLVGLCDENLERLGVRLRSAPKK